MLLVGSLNNTFDYLEASMDIELMMGLLGSNITLQLYQVGQENGNERKFRYCLAYPVINIFPPVDEFLAAFDNDFCSSDPVSAEGKRHRRMSQTYLYAYFAALLI